MLTLYVKTGCQYCIRVLEVGKELGRAFVEKNIRNDAVAAELLKRGGKLQVPYLVDTDRYVEMYQSADIEAYLRAYYPKNC